MRRVGIFGGTFDPVHRGHVALAEEVRAVLELETVRMVPCRRSPHKGGAGLTAGADRLAMLALATREHPALVPSSIELQRPAPSYTIDTLRELAADEPGTRFFFILGMDSFRELATWKDYEELIRDYHLGVVGRPSQVDGDPGDRLPATARERMVDGPSGADTADGRIHMLETTRQDVSSSAVRRRARQGEAFHGLVPTAVADYIRKCNLYRK